MRFGALTYPFHIYPDLTSIGDYVKRAESLGFDYVTIPEHIAFPKEHVRTMGETWWDPIVLATHLASVTRTIRFIFSVIVLPQRNPLYLAKEIATLDHVSNGRVSLGIGVGWIEREFQILGANFHQRGALTDEYIKVMKTLWTDDPAEFRGKYLSFSDVSFLPKPLQRPHPPIIVGGTVRFSLRRAAELGDGWMPMATSPQDFGEALTTLKRLRAERGRSAEDFSIVWRLPWYERSAEALEHSRMAGSGSLGDLQGDALKAVDYVRHQAELGVTHLTVQLPTDDLARRNAELERFAREVLRVVQAEANIDSQGHQR